MNFILVDVNRTNFLPLTYTRPVADLRIGVFKIVEKWEKYLNTKVSHHTELYLGEKFPSRFSEDNIFINSNCLPTPENVDLIKNLSIHQSVFNDETWVAYRSHRATFQPPLSNENSLSINCKKLKHWWDIFALNGEEIEKDIQNFPQERGSISSNNTIIGSNDKLWIHPTAKVEGVILNTNGGSIIVGPYAEIMEGSIIRGPFVLGEGSTIKMGAKIYGPTTIGPKCKVGGEVKNCVFQGYSNKSHDGYLGNSVLGEWINLGADTNCSNLKNTFDDVKVWNYATGILEKSGNTFIGTCIGDYSKTGINTMINTGSVIGVNCNVFGGDFPPKYLPNFSWGLNNSEFYLIDKAIKSNQKMAEFTGETLSEFDLKILQHLYNQC